MEENIFNTIKKLLGLSIDDESFDTDIFTHINTAFSVLNQLGMIPFALSTKEETWSDYIDDASSLNTIKTYIFAKVRKAFDPPQNSTAMEALTQLISELEWRINVAVDTEE